jgi:galactokinase
MQLVAAPGRVNLIGEHIDYHGLAVLPMALRRRISVRFRARGDRLIRAKSEDYGPRAFEWTPDLAPVAAGDWENYLRAAAQAVSGKWGVGTGIDCEIASDLPAAAGLSSSSALIVGVTIALLRANGREATFEELMDVLPEGEHFVGTRGGGMDHAACLASKEGCASLIEFQPLSVRHVPVPRDWGFLVSHSLETAEKSGAVREHYNARRKAGTEALRQMGFATYREAVAAGLPPDTTSVAPEFVHTVSEALRVREAVDAMERADAPRFARLLLESHASLRDRLRVSCPALDRLVEAAMESGALGARLTGAGFGGCAVVFAWKGDLAAVRSGLIKRFYGGKEGHIIEAEPGPGVLCPKEA